MYFLGGRGKNKPFKFRTSYKARDIVPIYTTVAYIAIRILREGSGEKALISHGLLTEIDDKMGCKDILLSPKGNNRK